MSQPAAQTPSPAPANPGRRAFFQWLTYAMGAAATAILAIPFVGYLLGRLAEAPGPLGRAGTAGPVPGQRDPAGDVPESAGPAVGRHGRHMGVYVRNLGQDDKQQDQFLVFAMNCAHLGCPVTWFPQSGLFMCPCHGGVYYEDGERASGPPPRGLFQLRLARPRRRSWRSRHPTCPRCRTRWIIRRTREDRR